jgi:hypothetical protein
MSIKSACFYLFEPVWYGVCAIGKSRRRRRLLRIRQAANNRGDIDRGKVPRS